jgi:chorismate dehydratase
VDTRLRLGRIRYINVLPIYYALEQAYVPNGFHMVSGTPAELNSRLFQGSLDASAISSVEYGRHFREYLLLSQLSISTEGDVGSVLLFSRVPFHRLSGKEVLLSEASATSVALVKILLYELFGARPLYRCGPVPHHFPENYYGLLAIGDEALRLRAAGIYPYFLDLGRAWKELTGLPFVFGVWAVRHRYYQEKATETQAVHQALLRSKRWGLTALEEICRQASPLVGMSLADLRRYFGLLNYELEDRQQEGLLTFYRFLYRYGELAEMPTLRFV